MENKVYQGVIEHFIGSNSGYGTVRTMYGNIFTNITNAIGNINNLKKDLVVKSSVILEYILDGSSPPVVHYLN